jgi:Na+(H+)/acetate symporter ActP
VVVVVVVVVSGAAAAAAGARLSLLVERYFVIINSAFLPGLDSGLWSGRWTAAEGLSWSCEPGVGRWLTGWVSDFLARARLRMTGLARSRNTRPKA